MKERLKALIREHRRAAVAISGLLLGIFIFAAFRLARGNNIQYFTAEVEEGDVLAVVQATGSINAVTTVQVGSQVSGRIAELSADFNSQVKKGQVIAQIDPSTFRARVLQAEADLENAQAGVKATEANIENTRADASVAQANLDKARAGAREAELNLQRVTGLFQQGIASEQQRDSTQVAHETAIANLKAAEAQLVQAQARLRSTQAQLEQARAQVTQRRAQLEMARLDLDHTVIRAPIDGTVIARNVDVGQTVAASLQAPTLFTIAQDLTRMLVYAKTDEADVGKIRVGAQTTFRVDSFPKETFRGLVVQVRMNATTIQNVVTYDTVIEFDNPERKLLPGMTAYVTIPIASARAVVRIPNGALRYRPEMKEAERRALLEKHGLLRPPQVQQARAETPTAAAAAEGHPEGRAAAGGSGERPRPGGEGSGREGESQEERTARMRERWQQMSPQEREQMRQRMMAMRGTGGGGNRPDAPQVRFDPASQREGEYQIVWKLNSNNTLQPLRVKTGITDYTYTAMLEGELKPGDKLVIGQTSRQRQAQQMPGGFGGMPRRF